MLIRNLDLLFDDPLRFFLLVALVAFALMVGITIHEFSHALVADRLGDATARRLGRLSLNPLAHLDPLGTIMLFLVGFGWGKPVPVNAYNLQNGRRSMALVAAAGPISNLIAVFLFALPIRLNLIGSQDALLFGSSFVNASGLVLSLLAVLIFYNIVLAVFNLLPIFPLDGSNILLGVLPEDAARSYVRLARYGPVLLILVIMLDYMFGLHILGRIMDPAIRYIGSLAGV